MGWLKKIGLGGMKEEAAPRRLEHPRDLSPGDMVQFEFASQAEISNKTFTVTRLWALSTGEGAAHLQIYYGLQEVSRQLRLRVVDEEQIEIAIEVLPDSLLTIFKQHNIIDLLESEEPMGVLKRRKLEKVPESFHPWTAPLYRREGVLLAYRFEGDYRTQPIPDEADAGEVGCDYHCLVSDDRQHSVEFRVFDGGRTEVHLCAVIPRRKLEALWPAPEQSS
ncbi:MAG: hypothetical protein HON68_06670 [Gammaproteobacteria bacterium]|jgi:hypothetical protein|nr:hypothetical protein [Gammaproteobacteria bacterium]MBT3489320.1 hypothetical protein [Gammaproteobacteria bacterium]MBT3718728.1 hypothetical protein [Gammaproteobacteria bacterium]MBT3844627.1 hypothetical protein [Gammaproteobacteria bacterium]MBT3893349.1 hypothetical protein [Gammaproteobacteria bacterium]